MNPISFLLVLATMACMYLSQRKATPLSVRRTYSFLGSAAAIMVAIESAGRGENGTAAFFAIAAAASLIGSFLDLKPKKDA